MFYAATAPYSCFSQRQEDAENAIQQYKVEREAFKSHRAELAADRNKRKLELFNQAIAQAQASMSERDRILAPRTV